MLRYIVVLFSLFAILFLGAVNIGPLSIRNLCVIGFAFFLLFSEERTPIDICGKLYVLYLIILLLCNIVNGQVCDLMFFKNFLTNHITSLVLLLALPVIVKSMKDINMLIGFVTIVQILNCVVSVLQFYNMPVGWHLGLAINPGAISLINQADYYLASSDNLLSRSLVFGITSFVVANGYYLAVFLPIVSHTLLGENTDYKRMAFSFFMLVLSSITIFMVQQRMAFFLLMCYGLLVVYMRVHKSLLRKFVVILILIVLVATFWSIPIDYDLGRLTLDNISSDSRMNQITNLLNFLNSDDFIWGANLNDTSLLYSMGHNTLMDALRRGGFISLMFYIPLFFIVIYKCTYMLFVAYKNELHYTFVLSVSCLIFMIYSFSHSTGLQSGAVLFWFVYAILISAWKYEKDSLSY